MDPNSNDLNMNPGCWVALLLLVAAVAGMARGVWLPDGDDDGPLRVIPGGSWRLTVPTDLKTVNGLCRIDDPRAVLRLDGDAAPLELPVEGVNQDTWGEDTEVVMVTVHGVPVISGRDEATLVFRFDLTQGADWVGRDATLHLTADVVHPFTDVDDVLVGSVLGSLSYEERTYEFVEESIPLHFVADKADEAAALERDRLFNFLFTVLALVAVALGVRSFKPEEASE